MKLRKLHLLFFRQHQDSFLEFGDGITGILGLNGAGKTTLLEAIAFALYGSKALRGTVSSVRSRNAKKGEKTTVVLWFEHEGERYCIERRLDGAHVTFGGEPKALVEGTAPVTAWVEQLLCMNYEEFSATYLTEQKSLEFLRGKRGTAERERFVLKMFGFDKIEEAQSLLRNRKRELSMKEESFSALQREEELTRELEDLQRQLDQSEKELTRAGEALQAAQKQSADEKKILDRLTPQVTSAEQVLKRYNHLETQAVSYGERLSELEDEKSTILRELESLGEEDGISSQEVAAQVQVVHEQLENVEEERRSARSTWDRQVATHREKIASLRKTCSSLTTQLSKISDEGDAAICPTCEQEIGPGLEVIKNRLLTDLTGKQALLRSLEAESEELMVEPLYLKDLALQFETLKAEQQELVARLQSRQQAELLRQRLERVKEELLRYEALRNQALEQVKEISDQVADQERFHANYNLVRQRYETAERFVEVSRLQYVRAQGTVDTQRALCQRCSQERLRAREEAALKESIVRERHYFDLADDVLTKFRKHINAEFRPALAERASQFLAELSEGRYAQVEIAQDFSPTVVEDGSSKEVISGGEEDLLQLCVRLALSSLLAERSGQHFSLLVLDEVFGSLDYHRRAGVLGLLEGLKNRFEQVILISHFQDVRDWVDHLVTVDFDETSGELTVTQDSGEGLEDQQLALVENF